MSVLFISPKGGNCTTVTAAATALLSAMSGRNTLLIDMCGDLPATMGMAEPTRPGINDWLGEHHGSDAASLVLMGEPLVDGLVVVHRGSRFVEGQPRWDRFAEAIASLPHTVVIDAGTGFVPEHVVAGIDRVTMVTKPCYLSLRRATMMSRPHDVAVIAESGRALSVADVSHVLGVPVSAEVPHTTAIARAVDAGLLPSRVEALFARSLDGLIPA